MSEQLQEIEVLALRKYGRPYTMLTKEEKAAIYRDYVGERQVANEQYMQGQDLLNTENNPGVQAGNIYVGSGYGNAAATLLKQFAGRRKQKKAEKDLAGLSKDYQMGSQAAGDVAAWNNQERMRSLSELLRRRRAPAPEKAAPRPAPTRQLGKTEVPSRMASNAIRQKVTPSAPAQDVSTGILRSSANNPAMAAPYMNPQPGVADELMGSWLKQYERRKKHPIGSWIDDNWPGR